MEPKPEETSVTQPEEEEKKETIKHVGKILNEDGEWVEYVEEVEADKPPIAYTYMGGECCPIEPDSEVVDFCMQYRIPKIEGLEDCKGLKVSKLITNSNKCRNLDLERTSSKRSKTSDTALKWLSLSCTITELPKLKTLNH